jgi:hypothetical protein
VDYAHKIQPVKHFQAQRDENRPLIGLIRLIFLIFEDTTVDKPDQPNQWSIKNKDDKNYRTLPTDRNYFGMCGMAVAEIQTDHLALYECRNVGRCRTVLDL